MRLTMILALPYLVLHQTRESRQGYSMNLLAIYTIAYSILPRSLAVGIMDTTVIQVRKYAITG